MLEEAILATDLKSHLEHRAGFKELVESGRFDPQVEDHKSQLRQMVITAGDLSAAAKPFDSQQRVAELVYSEFFDQGGRASSFACHAGSVHLTLSPQPRPPPRARFPVQGDLETQLGANRDELMDLLNRKKQADLPRMQVGFIDFMCKPVYSYLSTLYGCFQPVLDQLKDNRAKWEQLQQQGPYKFVTPHHILYADRFHPRMSAC